MMLRVTPAEVDANGRRGSCAPGRFRHCEDTTIAAAGSTARCWSKTTPESAAEVVWALAPAPFMAVSREPCNVTQVDRDIARTFVASSGEDGHPNSYCFRSLSSKT